MIFFQQLNNMDPGDLLSFLDGPGDLATPPSSGDFHDCSAEIPILSWGKFQWELFPRRWLWNGEARRALFSGRSPISLRLKQTINILPSSGLNQLTCIFTMTSSLVGHFHLYRSTRRTGFLIWGQGSGVREPGLLLPHGTLALLDPWYFLWPASISQNTETSQIFHKLENRHPLVANMLRPAVQAIVRAMYNSSCTNLSQHRVQPSIQLPCQTISARYSSSDYWKSIGKLFRYRIFLESMY